MKLPVNYEELHWTQRKKVREKYIRKQKGLCMYCKAPLTSKPPRHIRERVVDWSLFPPNFLKYPVHLQHSHTTGMTEGAVHAKCNAVMWQYEGR